MYTPIYSKHGIDIYHGDSVEILRELPWMPGYENIVDLWLTDPPYGIDYQSLRGKESIKNDAYEETKELAEGIVRHVRTFLKDGASYYVFSGTHGPGARIWEVLLERASRRSDRRVNWRPIQTVVWDKRHFGTGAYFRYQHERAFYGCYGKKPKTWNGGGNVPDVLRCTRIIGELRHPTEKPIELIKDLIRYSSNEGDLVLDTFGGSGVVAAACKALNRRCMSIELDEKHIKTTIDRLENNEKEKQADLF